MGQYNWLPKWKLQCIIATIIWIPQICTFDIQSCNDALGMESGDIPDEAITASSSYVPNVGARNGRLRIEKAGGGWCPKQQVEQGIREYIQVDLGNVHMVTGVQTQGRFDRGRGQEYAEEYTIEYWRPGMEDWREYKRWDGKQILRGNTDTSSVESHRLMPPVFASKVRVLPYSVHRRTVCLRLELLGCIYEGGIMSYSAPVGGEVSQGLWDTSYDGRPTLGEMQGGLGRLVDGEYGADNYRLDIGYGKGNGWVGWRNDTVSDGYVELIFAFDQVRNFSAVHLFTNNFFSKNVQVFSKAKIMFSIGGTYYNGNILSYTYMPDRVLENARNVTIRLHERLARFVKIRLYFADRWIMLSEVSFDAVPAAFNATEEETLDLDVNEIVVNSNGNQNRDTFETIAARKDGDGYVEVIIGVLTAIMLLLLVVFVIILIVNRRHKLQGSPTLLRNPFGVTINMKELLMTFSSSNGNASANASNTHPIPIAQEQAHQTDPRDDGGGYEQFRAPLVNSTYYAPNYATLRISRTLPNDVEMVDDDDDEEPPEVPPLPSSPSLHQSPITALASPMQHYRSLESTPAISPKSKMINLGNYFPRVASDPPNRKRYHTAPREKQRIPPPVICWNIAPSMGHSYTCRETEPPTISRYSMTTVENIGSCHCGEISLCEIDDEDDEIITTQRLVIVRTSRSEMAKSDAMDSLREVRFLAGLSDPNLCHVLGICVAEHPSWAIFEYGEMGDLAQYLQFLANRNGTVRSSQDSPISAETLIYMSTQIASGMKYLESKHVVHKDLATRNCLVGRGYIVKITDIAICKPQYRKDYAEIGGRPPAPIRWLPWESILLDHYTCASSVWSFAVTMWEILGLVNEKPYQGLSNEEVIQNAEHMYYGGEPEVLLEKPLICPPEIYDLLCQCWKRDEAARPTFKQIFLFLKHTNSDYVPSD